MGGLKTKAFHYAMNALPPALALRIQCIRQLGYNPDFRRPRRFNEHIHARKLFERDPRFAALSDKVLVKDYIGKRIGEQYLIPTLWSGVELPETPPSWPTPFVVKSNHSSGWNIFVRNAADLERWPEIRREAASWLKQDWTPFLHEWWYNNIDRKILIEPMIAEEPLDYKFFCFDGEPRYIQIDFDRHHAGRTKLFYDTEWNLQPFTANYPRRTEPIERPQHLDQMVEIARTLSAEFSFVRVDLYDLPSGPLFGELTFSPGSGLMKFDPPEYDEILGSWWQARPVGRTFPAPSKQD